MRKTIYFLFIGIPLCAQVGINTPTPKSTLDVTAKSGTNDTDGLQAPRLTRTLLTNKGDNLYGGDQKGALIYITDISGGNNAGQRVNVNSLGYYYFDGSLWQKILDNSTVFSGTNIYNSDGSLAGNRTVTQGANKLSFKANSVNAFSVNNAFSVDAANNKVGIGTIAPASLLHVQNQGGVTSNTFVSGISNCGIPCGQGVSRSIVLFNENTSGYSFGSIDFVPSNNSDNLSGASIQGIDRDITNNFSGLSFFTRNASNYASRLIIKSSGKIGIGTENPSATLHIQGTNPSFRLEDGTQGTDKVLTSDANGNARWTSSSATKAPIAVDLPSAGVDVTSLNTWFNTNISITLPPGKWLLNMGTTLSTTPLGSSPAPLNTDGQLWNIASISNSNSSYTVSSDIMTTISGSQVAGSHSRGDHISTISGTIAINNTSTSNKTYYLWVQSLAFGTVPSSFRWRNAFGSQYLERWFYASPIN
ncbi:hypothetical protein NZD88_17295 [Chryseobacterium antibioticum]|uniref:Uncharacterized protein n=1 Tax=Chryseobacterium pyrolae TaxID=2987481 RepID=A0ABT2IL93_9FLAO|nr:hypothetical protein [Chryseobacterium pyrolae]MCT2409307.1 hypothetical protein [Chryseobacterium pyrolae]